MPHHKNPNHPKRGSQIKVEPIRRLKDIKLIKAMLQNRPIDYALFVIGINTNLRASDLLRIHVGQVKDLPSGGLFQIREKKTGKYRQVVWNEACVEATQQVIRTAKYKEHDYLFTGRRGVWRVSTVNNKVKEWCKTIRLKGNYGSHTLRKTWGYHQYHTFHQPLPVICECFNHSSQRQTLAYLCLQAEEIKDAFMNSL